MEAGVGNRGTTAARTLFLWVRDAVVPAETNDRCRNARPALVRQSCPKPSEVSRQSASRRHGMART